LIHMQALIYILEILYTSNVHAPVYMRPGANRNGEDQYNPPQC